MSEIPGISDPGQPFKPLGDVWAGDLAEEYVPRDRRPRKTSRRRRLGLAHDPMVHRKFVRALVEADPDERGDLVAAARKIGLGRTYKQHLWYGSVLGRHPEVRRLLQRAVERYEAKTERIVEELARVAFLDPRDVLEWGPDGVRIRPSEELDDAAAHAVAEVQEHTNKEGHTDVRVRFHDKVGALTVLAKIRKLLGVRLELTGANGGPLEVQFYLPQNGREPATATERRAAPAEVAEFSPVAPPALPPAPPQGGEAAPATQLSLLDTVE